MFKINKLLVLFLVLITTILLTSCIREDKNQNNYTGSTITGAIDDGGIENSSSGSIDKNTGYNGIDNTDLGLNVSDDFSISIFVDGVPGARDIVGPDIMGNFILSRTKQGAITIIETTSSGEVNKIDILTGLNNPHGLALDSDGLTLYYAETDKISKIGLYSDGNPEKIIDLPKGGRHFTRSLIFGPDGKLYVSIGSTCDTCYEQDEKIAAIYRLDKDGSNFEKVASGLRNSVFMDINPITGDIWATEMGRDNLGDDLPPDEINIIKMGNDYGWPLCYGQNIHDSKFDKNVYIADPCMDKTPAHIELQAHSAPLGLSFIPEEGWPMNYGNDLLVSYHGSWNRSEPTGYKIVQVKLDDMGNEISKRDFIAGWINDKGNVLGRPVDIISLPGGISYITDDENGVVYKLMYNNKEFVYIDKQSFDDKENKIKADIEVNKNNVILINGEATGTWYFEAIFGIKLVDENNNKLVESYVTASSDWMKEDYVPFSGKLEYNSPETEYGYLIFERANPSGLPENKLEKRIKIKLK